jgi:hypothetical protein
MGRRPVAVVITHVYKSIRNFSNCRDHPYTLSLNIVIILKIL